MEMFTMRKACKDVIIAAKHWQSVYEADADYDGIDGCIARATLSLAIDKLIKDEKAQRRERKARRRAAKVSRDFIEAANEPNAFVTEDGVRYVRQADGSYHCDGDACGEGPKCGSLFYSFTDAQNLRYTDFAGYE
jgi:hypothetical protein